MNPKTKILIAIDWYRPAHKAGGPITSIENLVNLLGDEPHLQFYVVCSSFDYGEQQPLNVPQESWVTLGKAQVQYWHPNKLGWKQWMQIYHTLQPDIIHTQGLWSPRFSILPLLAAQRYKKAKIIVSPRGMLTPQALKQNGLIKAGMSFLLKTLRAYKNVIFHSTNNHETEEIGRFLNQRFLNLPRFLNQPNLNTQKLVLGKTLDNTILQMPNVPRNLGLAAKSSEKPETVGAVAGNTEGQIAAEYQALADETKAVAGNTKRQKHSNQLHWLFVGRISPEKNPLLLLEALQLLQMPTKGYFIGSAQNKDYLQQFQEKRNALPKQHQVEYLGEQSTEEITDFLSHTDVLINTSVSENFGHAMAEALSAGVPIIVGPNTPWQNLWEEQAGMVAQYSAQGFADAMQTMGALDLTEHQAFQKGALKRFATQCELSLTKAKYLNLYLLSRG